MITFHVPIEVDEKGNGSAPLPDLHPDASIEHPAPDGKVGELAIIGHAGANATVEIRSNRVWISNARPYGYFTVSWYVSEEHDVRDQPITDEPRDAPSYEEILAAEDEARNRMMESRIEEIDTPEPPRLAE